MIETKDEYLKPHYVHRSNWLRAVVLGANDGIISTASLAVGVAVASVTRDPVILATLAGLIAGALSMAAGEYVSVSSQRDLENADIEREKKELADMPEIELHRLAQLYEERGVERDTALKVARQLMQKDALDAHLKDELNIDQSQKANPLQAALASAAAFTLGGVIPLIVVYLMPLNRMPLFLYLSTLLALILLGIVSAKTGGSSVIRAVIRVCLLGTMAMLLTGIVGYIFGVTV